MTTRQLEFVAASASMGTVFAATGSPGSLYETYRVEKGVDTDQLTVVATSYCVAVALLFFGRISDHLGRKPVTFAVLGFAAAGCLLMLNVDSAGPLITGRTLQGLGGGLASSAVVAAIVDTAPARPVWLGSVITGTVPMVGLPVGALISRALVQFAPAPQPLVYLILTVLLAVCAVLVACEPEAVRRVHGTLGSIRPRTQIAAGSRCVLPAAGAVILGTWVIGSFYQAYSPAVSGDQFGSTDALVAAAVFASIMLLDPLGGLLTGRLSPAVKQRLGMRVLLSCIAGVILSLAASATVGAAARTGDSWGVKPRGSRPGPCSPSWPAPARRIEPGSSRRPTSSPKVAPRSWAWLPGHSARA